MCSVSSCKFPCFSLNPCTSPLTCRCHNCLVSCLNRRVRPWREPLQSITSWSQQPLVLCSWRQRPLNSSSSPPLTSWMGLPRWRPSMYQWSLKQKVDLISKLVKKTTRDWCCCVLFHRQLLTYVAISKTPVLPIAAAYIPRGSLQYEFATELLQTPIQLLRITNAEAQVCSRQTKITPNQHNNAHLRKITLVTLPVLTDRWSAEPLGDLQRGQGPWRRSSQVCWAHPAPARGQLRRDRSPLVSVQGQASLQVGW